VTTAQTTHRRLHTGRRRNEEVRRAILDAALRLLRDTRGGTPSVEAIAAEAGVGKQTIYRWWSSKAAVIAEAMTGLARVQITATDSGDLSRDLEAFLIATFRNARNPAIAAALRALMAEAQSDVHASGVLRAYTAERRAALQELFERSKARGEIGDAVDVSLLVDQAFGVIWYRLLVGHAPLTRTAAIALANRLVLQARVDA
jgi:AcrR family transcriptional regulator